MFIIYLKSVCPQTLMSLNLIYVVFPYTRKPIEDCSIFLYQEDIAKPVFMLLCASIIAVMHE